MQALYGMMPIRKDADIYQKANLEYEAGIQPIFTPLTF